MSSTSENAGRGLVSEQGARIATVPGEGTFQLTAAAAGNAVARFRNADQQIRVTIPEDGVI